MYRRFQNIECLCWASTWGHWQDRAKKALLHMVSRQRARDFAGALPWSSLSLKGASIARLCGTFKLNVVFWHIYIYMYMYTYIYISAYVCIIVFVFSLFQA